MDLLNAGVLADKLHMRGILDALGIVELSKRIYYKEQMKVSADFYDKKKDDISVILNNFADEYSREVYKKCIDYRCHFLKKDRPPYGPGEQYFDEYIISALNHTNKKQVFVDCGAFIGDTIDVFKKYVHDDYEAAVGFEPDSTNADALLENHKDDSRVTCVQTGVWSHETFLNFVSGEGGSSRIIESDEKDNNSNVVSVKVRAIDDVDECKNATFIKMDIEGSEMKALEGAKKVIRGNRPILAICIYHSDNDMIDIPLWIIDHCQNYNFYCRHYSVNIIETVFYAIPKEY